MPYADLTQLKADYLPNANSAAETAFVTRLLDNVSVFVDSYCRRTSGYFNPASVTATERRIRGGGQHFLRLPVHVFGSITTVKLNGSTIDAANYYESDKNGWLYFENNGVGLENTFSESWNRIWFEDTVYKVTARWGYAATPLDLQEAVRQTVAAMYDRQKGELGDVSPDGFIIERAMPLFAREVFNRYRRREFEI